MNEALIEQGIITKDELFGRAYLSGVSIFLDMWGKDMINNRISGM